MCHNDNHNLFGTNHGDDGGNRIIYCLRNNNVGRALRIKLRESAAPITTKNMSGYFRRFLPMAVGREPKNSDAADRSRLESVVLSRVKNFVKIFYEFPRRRPTTTAYACIKIIVRGRVFGLRKWNRARTYIIMQYYFLLLLWERVRRE